MKNVAIIVLNNIDYPNYKIIVMDNGSTDGLPEMIESDFPEVKLIRNKENLRFSGGIKSVLMHILGKKIRARGKMYGFCI